MIFLSTVNGGFELTIDNATITFDELVIRPRSNFTAPFEVVGRGGARIVLLPEDMVELLAQWLFMTVSGPIKIEKDQAGKCFKFEVSRETS